MSDIQAANHIVANRVVPGTKSNYRGKVNTIILYCISRPDHDSLFNERNDLICPLPADVVKALFGWLSTNTDLPKKKGGIRRNNQSEDDEEEEDDEDSDVDDTAFGRNDVTISFSCMQGYKSALLW